MLSPPGPGPPSLAWLERPRGDDRLGWRLRLAPVEVDPLSGEPSVSAARARTLADDCAGHAGLLGGRPAAPLRRRGPGAAEPPSDRRGGDRAGGPRSAAGRPNGPGRDPMMCRTISPESSRQPALYCGERPRPADGPERRTHRLGPDAAEERRLAIQLGGRVNYSLRGVAIRPARRPSRSARNAGSPRGRQEPARVHLPRLPDVRAPLPRQGRDARPEGTLPGVPPRGRGLTDRPVVPAKWSRPGRGTDRPTTVGRR